MPVVGVGAAALAGLADVGMGFYVALAPVMVLLDALVLLVAVRLFDRERVLTRWS